MLVVISANGAASLPSTQSDDTDRTTRAACSESGLWDYMSTAGEPARYNWTNTQPQLRIAILASCTSQYGRSVGVSLRVIAGIGRFVGGAAEAVSASVTANLSNSHASYTFGYMTGHNLTAQAVVEATYTYGPWTTTHYYSVGDAVTITSPTDGQAVPLKDGKWLTVSGYAFPNTVVTLRAGPYGWSRTASASGAWSTTVDMSALAGSEVALSATSAGTSYVGGQVHAVTINLGVAPQVTSQPVDSVIASGSAATFTVAAGGTAPLGVQWQWSTNGTTWTDATAASARSWTLTTAPRTAENDGQMYRAVVTSSWGEAISEVAKVVIAGAPQITMQPEDAYAAVGSSASFTVAATGVEPLTVQWQYSPNGGQGWESSSESSATSWTLTTPPRQRAHDGYQYRAVITDGVGQTTTSRAATVHVGTAPTITTQPVDADLIAGSSASFTVAASGSDPLSVQWLWSGDGGKSWSDAKDESATSWTLTTPPRGLDANGQMHRARVTNPWGSVLSDPVEVRVRAVTVGGATITISSELRRVDSL